DLGIFERKPDVPQSERGEDEALFLPLVVILPNAGKRCEVTMPELAPDCAICQRQRPRPPRHHRERWGQLQKACQWRLRRRAAASSSAKSTVPETRPDRSLTRCCSTGATAHSPAFPRGRRADQGVFRRADQSDKTYRSPWRARIAHRF